MKQIFIEDVNMETQTVFSQRGTINIYPCDFELGQHQLLGGARRVCQRGRMVTDENGTSCFTPYRQNSGSRYMVLMQTDHGQVKTSQENVIVRLTFPKKMTTEQMKAALFQETDDMAEWIRKNCKLNF